MDEKEKQIRLCIKKRCSNCHFTWKPGEDTVNMDYDQLEKKLLIDITYDKSETIPAYALLAYLFAKNSQWAKARTYAKKTYTSAKELSNDCYGRKGIMHVAFSVYAHVLYLDKKWTHIHDIFRVIKEELSQFSSKDKCQIQLIKAYAYSKAVEPSYTKIIDACKLAQKHDDENPESYYREALELGRQRRRYVIENTHFQEMQLLKKSVSLWKDKPEYVTYPNVMLAEVETDKITKQITPGRKGIRVSLGQKNQNHERIRDTYENACELYKGLNKEYRNANKSHDMIYRIFNQLTMVPVPEIAHRSVQNQKKQIIEEATKLYPNDTNMAYHIGQFYFYVRPPCFLKAKQYLEFAMQSPAENKWAQLLLIFTMEDKDKQRNSLEALMKKHEKLPHQEKADLYFKAAIHLKKRPGNTELAKTYLFSALECSPVHKKSKEVLLSLLDEMNKSEQKDYLQLNYDYGHYYLLIKPIIQKSIGESHDYLFKVYDTDRSYKHIKELLCQVLLKKATFEPNDTNKLCKQVIEISSEKCQTNLIRHKAQAYVKLAEHMKEQKTNYLAQACQLNSTEACEKLLSILESTDCQSGISTDACEFPYNETRTYEMCAVMDPENRTYQSTNDNIKNRILNILKINMDEDIPTNFNSKDLLHLRRKRYALCCSYETNIGYTFETEQEETYNEANEELLIDAEGIMLYTRIVLDRTFKSFVKQFYKTKQNVYFPVLHSVANSLDGAKTGVRQILEEEYEMEGFGERFPKLLQDLACHQAYKHGGEISNSFLKHYFQFTNQSKHETSITSQSFLKKMRKKALYGGHPIYDFTQQACDYTESVVHAIFKSKECDPNQLQQEQSLSPVHVAEVVLLKDSFLKHFHDVGDTSSKHGFSLKKVELVDDPNGIPLTPHITWIKSNIKCLSSKYIVIQLGISHIEHEMFSVNRTVAAILILSEEMLKQNDNVNLVIIGVPYLPNNISHLKESLTALHTSLKINCALLKNIFFVESRNYKEGSKGHLEENDQKEWFFNEKGIQKWMRDLGNALKYVFKH